MPTREKLKEYVQFVDNMLKPEIRDGPTKDLFCYLTFKLNSEVGEFIGDWAKKHFHNADISDSKLMDELSDCLFYCFAIIATLDDLSQNDFFRAINQSCQGNKSSTPAPIVALSQIQEASGDLVGDFRLDFIKNARVKPSPEFWANLKSFIFDLGTIINSLDFSIDDIIEINIKKLSLRHGSSYNPGYYAGV